MYWPARHRMRHAVESSAEQLLSRFGLAASASGKLWIRPVGPLLSYEELDLILNRILDEASDQRMNQIILDLSNVEWIQVPWTAVIARLIDFARRVRVECRLVGVHGQPAAIIEFFDANDVIRRLLHVDPLHSDPPSALGGMSA